MDKLYRPPVNLKSMILSPLFGKNLERTDSKYIELIQKFERNIEKSLIKTFSKINITSSVKTIPYSLPFKEEIVVELKGESYLNGAYEIHRVARQIIKELLNKNVYNLRFYMFVNIVTSDTPNLSNIFGKIEYRFRYYEKIYNYGSI